MDKMRNINRSLMMIFLLEECNFNCNHCLREEEPMPRGYKLSSRQLKLCLEDCKKLETVEWVHFSGGEPTLWKQGKLGVIDLLKEISKAGFEPGFTTNGNNIINYNKCNKFLQKYFNYAKKRLRLYISIDTFHRNFDPDTGRARSLDNVIKFKMNLSNEKKELLNINVLSTISKDSKSLLPDEMIEHYQSLGVKFIFTPLRAAGKAKLFSHLCPNLESGTQKELGAYYSFYKKKKGEQDPTTNIVLIDNDYYFPERWQKVGQLGFLPSKIIDIYKMKN